MSGPPYDPRAIANLMLDEAERDGLHVTNLALQKLLYFAHAHFLISTKQPLLKGTFEAWQYGPVHPAVYQAFKVSGSQPIEFRATKQDVLTGAVSKVSPIDSLEATRVVRSVLRYYGHLTPGRLVEISHAPKAPWHFIVESGSPDCGSLGLRIPNDVISSHFKHHKVPVGTTPLLGEPSEEKPPS